MNPAMTDVAPKDYVPGWSAEDGGELLRRFEEWKSVLVKRLNHITAYRIRLPSKMDERYIVEIGEDFESVLQAWWVRPSLDQPSWFELLDD